LGSEAGNAMADVLFGDYNPSGKLPMSFPRSEGQIPVYYSYKSTGRPSSNDYGTGYKSGYIDLQNSPRYAFGYGLSYTQFELSDLKLDKTRIKSNENIRVTCTLKNTGKYDGEEVVQLYLRDEVGSVTRPVKELKGFEKIFLKAGETRTVNFVIDKEKLSFYDQKMNWTTEPGNFDVMIGNSSDHIVLNSKFELVQ
jgi:beta-glucosidase